MSETTRIVAIANGKGGVGKTTTTCTLGDSLASLGQRVLLVDLDPQSSLTMVAGINPTTLTASMHTALTHWARHLQPLPIEQYRLVLGPNLDLLPSNLTMLEAEDDLNQAPRREYILERTLSPALGAYDVILIDCPPSLTLLATNALTVAQEVIVPVSPEFLAMAGLPVLFNKIAKVRASGLNPGLAVLGFVLTFYESRTMHSQEMLQVLQVDPRLAPYPVLGMVKRSTEINKAASAGQPITRFRPSSEMAGEYRAIAARLLEHWGRRPAGAPTGAPDPVAAGHAGR